MSTRFPGTGIDDATTLPNPASSDTVANVNHASQHANANDAIKAVETKVGTGSSTAASNTLLYGTGAGTSAWQGLTSAQLASVLSDETGSGSAVFATTPTLVTPKVDTINESTPSNGTTIGGVNIKSGALNTNNSVPTAAIADSAVTFAKVATGAAVQFVYNQVATAATGTTIIPTDGTIPQNTEGDQFMTQAITPKSATNTLVIDVMAMVSYSVASKDITMALFQDTTANALSAVLQFVSTITTTPVMHVMRYAMVAGTTSSTTFKIRIGAETGGGGTLSFNAPVAVSPMFGSSIPKSGMWITEYKA